LLSAEQYVKFAKGISKNQAIMGVTRSPGIVGMDSSFLECRKRWRLRGGFIVIKKELGPSVDPNPFHTLSFLNATIVYK
jgi:hypothetical protein